MNHGFQYEVREANPDEWEDAMALAWRTFQRFEAHVNTADPVQCHRMAGDLHHHMAAPGALHPGKESL